MDEIFGGLHVLFEQLIRLLQIVGLPIFSVLLIVGFLLLLTSGKNPRRKKMGYVFTIVFGIGALLIAYAPLVAHSLGGMEFSQDQQNETVESMVDGAGTIGPSLYKGVWYISVPVVFTMFYFGLLVRLSAAKNPQRKRLGLGMMIFSPLVLLAAYLIPSLTNML
ncbi:hypothetical protein ABER99_20590 [Paenibacillus glucanolyticus]|jgi:FtsH-binding integral membrane protein|uniref:Uncharacterized protein n=1 Tax=Paenibacillus glucanolyticus TaxID=59843 RepID=A0A168EWP1_9BACL|nr:hypothetical protein [Paenibacillus glucanolyticus]KZS44897.1 hypothetical protein AWU65_02625 [Paenibacillus glucanolyticus]OMF65555.1 hypothetical protein BK142_30555 [Paenibacillus glucanolyticus]